LFSDLFLFWEVMETLFSLPEIFGGLTKRPGIGFTEDDLCPENGPRLTERHAEGRSPLGAYMGIG